MSTYFLLDPFEFPYYFYCILGELIYVLSIVACIPSTFCPTLGHHQGRIYYKSDLTFVLAYYNCVRASLPLKVLAFVFECDSIFSASIIYNEFYFFIRISGEYVFVNQCFQNFFHRICNCSAFGYDKKV